MMARQRAAPTTADTSTIQGLCVNNQDVPIHPSSASTAVLSGFPLKRGVLVCVCTFERKTSDRFSSTLDLENGFAEPFAKTSKARSAEQTWIDHPRIVVLR